MNVNKLMDGKVLTGTGETSEPSHLNPHPWQEITGYEPARGWSNSAEAAERARLCCEQLENGQILYFRGIPFDFPEADRNFLLQQRQSDARIHKNISYRPQQDLLRGNLSDKPEDTERLHGIMRHFSQGITSFLTQALAPYSSHWSLDFASFRPEEERGRKLSLHKRNDLLHVDAFPSRPTRGARILRCFTNINPTEPRVWLTTDRFPQLAESLARNAGLERIASAADRGGVANAIKRILGLEPRNRTAYDRFMLHFHDYMKESEEFQAKCNKIQISIAPLTTWMCFTDSVPHAVLSGRYAMEQTFIVPVHALVNPEKSPIRILERIAGQSLVQK